jgi:peptidoglycan LD-endopeptidase LytH
MSDEVRSNTDIPSSRRSWEILPHAILVVLMLFLLFLHSSPTAQNDSASQWNLLYLKIRDRVILKEEAQIRLKILETQLRDLYSGIGKRTGDEGLSFPLEGYTFHSIGGKNGSGYQVQSYDFFDGNDHKGHPGHDIFILDKNQDSLDDRTGKPVNVLAASSGMVVSTSADWRPPSPIRGGNFIWIFDPVKDRYYYYAHLNRVAVTIGEIIANGHLLGTVGRTGLNAYPARSPTHLHFTVHQTVNGYPRPINVYKELLRNR